MSAENAGAEVTFARAQMLLQGAYIPIIFERVEVVENSPAIVVAMVNEDVYGTIA